MEWLRAKELGKRHVSGIRLSRGSRISPAKSAFDPQTTSRTGSSRTPAPLQNTDVRSGHHVADGQHRFSNSKPDLPRKHYQPAGEQRPELVRRGLRKREAPLFAWTKSSRQLHFRENSDQCSRLPLSDGRIFHPAKPPVSATTRPTLSVFGTGDSKAGGRSHEAIPPPGPTAPDIPLPVRTVGSGRIAYQRSAQAGAARCGPLRRHPHHPANEVRQDPPGSAPFFHSGRHGRLRPAPRPVSAQPIVSLFLSRSEEHTS